jgi:endonuclease YncB( thermonuclease family)
MQRITFPLISRSSRAAAALLAWLLLSAAAPVATAEDILAGPVPALVEEVVDGDTLRVRARIWLGQEVATYVRLAGVDAPEVRGACRRERELARQAQDFLIAHLLSGRDETAGVQLREVRYGKYARRIVARVETATGLDLGAALLAAGLAQPYDGGRRPIWCN